MALTRKMLKGMGLSEEQADTIIEAHTETVDWLKEKLKTADDKAKTVDDLQKELDGLKANSGSDYKAKYEKEHSDFEAFKSEVTAKETKAAKEKAARAYFEAKNITGNNLAIALRGAKDEISGIELDDKGGIKDSKTLDALVAGEFASLVVKSSARGAATATPPGSKSSGAPMTRAEVYAKDDKGRFKLDASQRQEALAKIIQNEQKGV